MKVHLLIVFDPLWPLPPTHTLSATWSLEKWRNCSVIWWVVCSGIMYRYLNIVCEISWARDDILSRFLWGEIYMPFYHFLFPLDHFWATFLLLLVCNVCSPSFYYWPSLTTPPPTHTHSVLHGADSNRGAHWRSGEIAVWYGEWYAVELCTDISTMYVKYHEQGMTYCRVICGEKLDAFLPLPLSSGSFLGHIPLPF